MVKKMNDVKICPAYVELEPETKKEKTILYQPNRPKQELLAEFDEELDGSLLFFEVAVDTRDLLHEIRVGLARQNRALEAIATELTGKQPEDF